MIVLLQYVSPQPLTAFPKPDHLIGGRSSRIGLVMHLYQPAQAKSENSYDAFRRHLMDLVRAGRQTDPVARLSTPMDGNEIGRMLGRCYG